MVLCPRCSAELPEGLNFCPECETQIKCISCGRPLVEARSICLQCGTPVFTAESRSPQLNQLILEEEESEAGRKRRVRVVATDAALAGLGMAAMQHLLGQGSGPVTVDATLNAPLLPSFPEPTAPQHSAEISGANPPAHNSPARKQATRKRSSDRSKDKVSDEVAGWLERDLQMDSFDVRCLANKTAGTKLLFGLWVLKHKLHIDSAQLMDVTTFTLKKFPLIGGNAEALRKAASRSKQVERTSDGKYFLSQKGEELIAELLPEEVKSAAT